MQAISASEHGGLVSLCAHCASELQPDSADLYCCQGCRTVAALLSAGGLQRFYELGGGRGAPVSSREPSSDRAWLEAIVRSISEATSVVRIELDIQGMHCAGCVWLMGALLEQQQGGVDVVANPALGRLVLHVEPGFDLESFVDRIERLGYRVGPPLKSASSERDELLIRTAVAIALAANAMMFALAIYLGLREGPLFEVMRTLEVILSVAAVGIGAPVFVRSAFQGLRLGVLHLDLPIAIGMLLALGGSLWSFAVRRDAGYADTVAVFVALMLLGRWLQTHAVSRNRDRLLKSEGAGGLSARRASGGRLRTIRAREVREDDSLLVAPGEIAVVEGALQDVATASLDWISGESAPRVFERGEILPAGAINRGSSAVLIRAKSSFDRSPLEALLGRGEVDRDTQSTSAFWDRVVRVYVAAVLGAAALALVGWWWATADFSLALEVATAVLVVTCPCGIGIATPLAYELVTSALRERGLFIRRERALDRAVDVRRVAFDKTGTLTTGQLELAAPDVLQALTPADRSALSNLVARSGHPKSEAVRRALGPEVDFRPDVCAVEEAGRGICATVDGALYRLGSAQYVGGALCDADLAFSRDGVVLLALTTREVLREDAALELGALAASGYALAIVSGDAEPRVRAVIERLGLGAIALAADCDPQAKASWIDAHADLPTLFVGDGINDGLAADRAFLSGTPSVDRPFLPARSDFFFVTSGVAPIRALLDGAQALRRVTRRSLGFAVFYNTAAVSVSMAGLMHPWLAAIAMPASSLFVIATTSWSLRASRWADSGKNAQWKS